MSAIPFKRPKITNRFIRQKQPDNYDEDVSMDLKLVEEVKTWQNARKRPTGLGVDELNSWKDYSKEQTNNDGKKQKTGGYVDAKTLQREMENNEIHQITSFAIETNKRDEDEPLKKYVEERLAQIKGAGTKEDANELKAKRPDDALFELPENIKQMAQKKKTEESLSDQMLSGIPEVDLGIEVKIKNIEATEEAKMRLLRERLNKKDRGASEFVPTNIAVNFVQHNRFNIEDNTQPQRKPPPTPKLTPMLRVGDADVPCAVKGLSLHPMPTGHEKATDDFHYEKFKRHMR